MQEISGKGNIDSLKEINDLFLVLFYKDSSKRSQETKRTLKKLENRHTELNIFGVNIEKVKDIHLDYNIHETPTLLVFRNGNPAEIIKGKRTLEFYKELLKKFDFSDDIYAEEKQNVTVYTTPTCQFCDAVKTFLDSKGVDYTEVDVSKDRKVAKKLKKESGKQGVPQIEIDGEFVVGFDTEKLEQLLNT